MREEVWTEGPSQSGASSWRLRFPEPQSGFSVLACPYSTLPALFLRGACYSWKSCICWVIYFSRLDWLPPDEDGSMPVGPPAAPASSTQMQSQPREAPRHHVSLDQMLLRPDKE